jgi:hypothetical protein
LEFYPREPISLIAAYAPDFRLGRVGETVEECDVTIVGMSKILEHH